jgi:RND superfamily putative drug exporter
MAQELTGRARRLASHTATDAYVGGPAPTIRQFDDAIGERLPLLIVALSLVTYVGLVVVLRSVLLPLVGLVLNTLTVGAAFGVLALAFGGPGAPLGGPGYVDDIMAVAVLTIVLALSLDYQIFLLAGIREGYRRSGTTDGALRFGLERTAGVITGAAAIMCAVFAAFALSEMTTMRQLGIGLCVAVVIDATIVRLVLLPILLRRLGAAAWWFPAPLARTIPARWALGAH